MSHKNNEFDLDCSLCESAEAASPTRNESAALALSFLLLACPGKLRSAEGLHTTLSDDSTARLRVGDCGTSNVEIVVDEFPTHGDMEISSVMIEVRNSGGLENILPIPESKDERRARFVLPATKLSDPANRFLIRLFKVAKVACSMDPAPIPAVKELVAQFPRHHTITDQSTQPAGPCNDATLNLSDPTLIAARSELGRKLSNWIQALLFLSDRKKEQGDAFIDFIFQCMVEEPTRSLEEGLIEWLAAFAERDQPEGLRQHLHDNDCKRFIERVSLIKAIETAAERRPGDYSDYLPSVVEYEIGLDEYISRVTEGNVDGWHRREDEKYRFVCEWLRNKESFSKLLQLNGKRLRLPVTRESIKLSQSPLLDSPEKTKAAPTRL